MNCHGHSQSYMTSKTPPDLWLAVIFFVGFSGSLATLYRQNLNRYILQATWSTFRMWKFKNYVICLSNLNSNQLNSTQLSLSTPTPPDRKLTYRYFKNVKAQQRNVYKILFLQFNKNWGNFFLNSLPPSPQKINHSKLTYPKKLKSFFPLYFYQY